MSADGLRQKITPDEPSRSKRYRPNIHYDVDQCGPVATGSAPDSELLIVLAAEAARVASGEAQTRKRSRVLLSTKVEEGWKKTRRRREYELEPTLQRRVWLASTPPFGEPSFLEQNRVTAATVQRSTVTLNEFLSFSKMTMNELKLMAKLDEMVEMLEHL